MTIAVIAISVLLLVIAGLAIEQIRKPERERDWLIYIAIGVAVVLIATLYGMSASNPPHFANNRWVFCGIVGLCAFGYAVRAGWRHRKLIRFWLLFASLAAIHVAIFAAFFSPDDQFPLILAGPITAGEFFVITLTADALCTSRVRRHARRAI